MKTLHQHSLVLLPFVLLATACSTLRTTSGVQDDVYYMPSSAPVAVSTPSASPPEPTPTPSTGDDYYDPNAAATQQSGDFYDMTYNDPYYYNYGRFGFNSGPMGWQTGWNGPGWGGGMGWNSSWGIGMGWGWGYGHGVYSGWYRPRCSDFGWNNPWWWSGWSQPYCGWNSYGWGGYGNYYSPWGNYYGGYAPVVIGDGGTSNGVVVGHRRSIGSGGASGAGTTRRPPVRNPVGLAPYPDRNLAPVTGRTNPVQRGTPTNPTVGQDGPNAVQRERGVREPSRPTRSFDHGSPSRNDSGGGGRTSPSRGSGGGGGGTRTSPGRR